MDNIIDAPAAAAELVETLGSAGYEAYFVGGCVRDSLRGVPPHDWDITTSATPDEMKRLFSTRRTVETGLKHGTLTVISDKEGYEITSYRIDGEYTDNRRPSEVFFTRSLREDLARRDFTVNAMAYNPVSGLVDVFGGMEDLERGIIRCVGEPERRFAEDGLRILRALRFASVLDFEIEDETARRVRDMRGLLKNISAERIRDEFFKLVCGAGAERVLLAFPEVICEFIPELRECVGFDQQNPYHSYDVYTHSVKATAAARGDRTVKLALFFHDIGKPACFTEDELGGHFIGHPEVGAKMTETILRRLRADGATVRDVTLLVREHHRVIGESERGMRRLLAALGEENVRRLLELRRGDNSALIPELREERLSEIDKNEKLLDAVVAKDCCLSLRSLAIGGDDLIALGMKPGREIGRLLAALLDGVIDGTLTNERSALLGEARRRLPPEREEDGGS